MKAAELIEALSRKLGTTSQSELADVLGVTVGTLINWKNRNEDLSALQVASALAKSRSAAVRKSQFETIQPIVEFYSIDRCESAQSASWLVFNGGASANLYAKGLRDALRESHGIYIFYDSRGRALYVGKAREQDSGLTQNILNLATAIGGSDLHIDAVAFGFRNRSHFQK